MNFENLEKNDKKQNEVEEENIKQGENIENFEVNKAIFEGKQIIRREIENINQENKEIITQIESYPGTENEDIKEINEVVFETNKDADTINRAAEVKIDNIQGTIEEQDISTRISGKTSEEIYEIFSNKQEQSILLKSSVGLLRKEGKLTEAEQNTKEALLKFIEARPSTFENIIKSKNPKKNPDDVHNSILLYSLLAKNGNEIQQQTGIALLKNNVDLVKQITMSYSEPDSANKDYYSSDARLLRQSILEKGDKDIKAEAQKWFEEAINTDNFDVNTIFCLQRLYGKDKKSITELAKKYIEKRELPAEELLKNWKSAKIETHLGFVSIKKLEDKIPGAAKSLHEEFKISDFWRYPTEVLADQYNNRDNAEEPYGIIIFPKADHNGAFVEDSHLIRKLYNDTKGRYLIRIMESDGKFSLARNLLHLDKKYGDKHKISFALLGGHGSKNSIQFGPDKLNNFFNEKNNLKKGDFKGEGVKRVGAFFEENPSIALISCSTGKENGVGQKISETYGAEVSAPDRPASLIQLDLSFDQNGKIKFSTKYYHSGQEMKYSKGIKK